MKIILSLIFILVSTVSFTQEEDPWKYVEELTNELESNNELIEELNEENEKLKERNDELKDGSTKKEYNEIVSQLEETTEELENSNDLIIDLREELSDSQEEIDYFREKYEKNTVNEETETNMGIGLGATFPNGGEAIVSVDLPFLDFLSVYGRGGVQASNNFFHGGVGIMYRF